MSSAGRETARSFKKCITTQRTAVPVTPTSQVIKDSASHHLLDAKQTHWRPEHSFFGRSIKSSTPSFYFNHYWVKCQIMKEIKFSQEFIKLGVNETHTHDCVPRKGGWEVTWWFIKFTSSLFFLLLWLGRDGSWESVGKKAIISQQVFRGVFWILSAFSTGAPYGGATAYPNSSHQARYSFRALAGMFGRGVVQRQQEKEPAVSWGKGGRWELETLWFASRCSRCWWYNHTPMNSTECPPARLSCRGTEPTNNPVSKGVSRRALRANDLCLQFSWREPA